MAGVQSIERAFAILRVLALGPAGVTEIADRADLPKSTVSRLLTALESEGAVEQVDDGADYVVGEALRTLGGSSGPRATLRSVIRPFLEALSAATGGSAGFVVRRGREVYCADDVAERAELVRVAKQTGHSFPLHATASGLALLATLDPAEVDEYGAATFTRIRGSAPNDLERLRERLARIGRSGVVVSNEELDPGVYAMAIPFRGPSGAFDGALYVQGPAFRFPVDGDEARVERLLVDAATAISERFDAH